MTEAPSTPPPGRSDIDPDAELDLAGLAERTGGDRQVMHRVLRIFIGEARMSLRTLRAALERSNPRFAREYAYGLRVAAANVGADTLARSAGAAESALRVLSDEADIPPALESMLASLEAQLERFEIRVAAELGGASSGPGTGPGEVLEA